MRSILTVIGAVVVICVIVLANRDEDSVYSDYDYFDSIEDEEYEEDSYDEDYENTDYEYYESGGDNSYDSNANYEEVSFEQIQRNPQQYIGRMVVLEGNFTSLLMGGLGIQKSFWEDGNYEAIEVRNSSGVVYNQNGENIGNVLDTDSGYVAGTLQTDTWGDLYIQADIVCVYQ